jgi:hypothetical protein
MSPERLAIIVAAANVAGSTSRRSGAPTLALDSSRDTLVAWLKWNDPNGDWDKPYLWHEGLDGLFDPGWYVNADDGLPTHRFGDGALGEKLARDFVEQESPIADLWETIAEMLDEGEAV